MVPAGRVSSNIMMLFSPVSRPRSFNAKERPGVGEVEMLSAARGYDKAFVAFMLLSLPAAVEVKRRQLDPPARGRSVISLTSSSDSEPRSSIRDPGPVGILDI